MKAQLKHITPQQRYQQEKEHWYFHELSYLKQTVDKNTGKALDIIKEYGCGRHDNSFSRGGCVPDCRFYLKYGRIEDEEVIEEHNKWLEFYRQKNAIVEPPDMNSREAHEFFEQHPFLRR